MQVKQVKNDVNREEKLYLFDFMSKKYFNLRNRRFLGSKQKLLDFISSIVNEISPGFNVFCDIFAGTGVVGQSFNQPEVKIISNDLLFSNYIPLFTFLQSNKSQLEHLEEKIDYLNNIEPTDENYFSKHFGGRYFSVENARKIGLIREKIKEIALNQTEKYALISSLIYAADKVANTVGHYDAYRRKMYMTKPLELLIPKVPNHVRNLNNEVFKEDANLLVKKMECDILYIDPPYNSRQYSDTYHVLENLAGWKKPKVYGKAKKMDRSHLKSDYCLQSAPDAFSDLISNAKCKHILVSYNNTGESKDGRSNARLSDSQIVDILRLRGKVNIFEQDHKAFTTGMSDTKGHTERLFYCKVTK